MEAPIELLSSASSNSMTLSIISIILAAASFGIAAWNAWWNFKGFKNEWDPDVVVYLEPSRKNPKACMLVVKNFGRKTARNVRFCFSAGLRIQSDVRAEFENSFFSNGIDALVPGAERMTFIGFFPELCEAHAGKRPSVTVSYGKTHETFEIAFDSFSRHVEDESKRLTVRAELVGAGCIDYFAAPSIA